MKSHKILIDRLKGIIVYFQSIVMSVVCEEPSREPKTSSAEGSTDFTVAASTLRQKDSSNWANIAVMIRNDFDSFQEAEFKLQGLLHIPHAQINKRTLCS